HLAYVEIGSELNRRTLAAAQGRIAGASNTGKPAALQPAAHHIHVGAGAEPDEEPPHPFGREQLNQTLNAVEVHPRFCSAQIDAIEIRGGKRALAVGIDGDVTTAEGSAMELLANEAVRLASAVQPGGEPPHFQRQIDLVHYAPRELRCPCSKIPRRAPAS